MTGPAPPEVVSIGALLVEVMRPGVDAPLDRPGTFAGPFPSGDTAIYVDAVARLGRAAGYVGVIGDDPFGRCLLDRFARDGVDASQVQSLSTHTTGVASVAYAADRSRTFVFHWRNAAAGQLAPRHVRPRYLQRMAWTCKPQDGLPTPSGRSPSRSKDPWRERPCVARWSGCCVVATWHRPGRDPRRLR